MYACICHGLSEGALRTAIERSALDSLTAVRQHTGATTGCGNCCEQVALILDEHRLTVAEVAAPALRQGAGCRRAPNAA